jgi:cysteine-rich repeat protein
MFTQGGGWTQASSISRENSLHTLQEPTAEKLDDSVINYLRVVGVNPESMPESILYLRCGACNHFFKQDLYFVSSGTQRSLDLMSACSVRADGPFFRNDTIDSYHFGLSCDRYQSAYSYAHLPGCMCGGQTGFSGELYVRASEATMPQALLQVTATADSTEDGHRAANVLDGNSTSSWLSTAASSVHWLKLSLGDLLVDNLQLYVEWAYDDVNGTLAAQQYVVETSPDSGQTWELGTEKADSCNSAAGARTDMLPHISLATPANALRIHIKRSCKANNVVGVKAVYATAVRGRPCTVNEWNAFGACTRQCGGGTMTRARTVWQQPSLGGRECPHLEEARSCNTHPCKEDYELGLGMPAVSSSTNQDPESNSGPARRANDGDISPIFSKGSCMHTNQEDSPWWRVDLSKEYRIDSVQITARGDCCPEMYNNLEVHVGRDIEMDNGNGNQLCGSRFAIPQNRQITIKCTDGTVGRFVNILKDAEQSELAICEVQIYGGEVLSYNRAVELDRPTVFWSLQGQNPEGEFTTDQSSQLQEAGRCKYEDEAGAEVVACPAVTDNFGYSQLQANTQIAEFSEGTFIRIPARGGLKLRDQFAIECWVKPYSLGFGMTIFNKWDINQNQRGWRLYLDANAHLVFEASTNGHLNGAFNETLTIHPLEIDKWYYITLVYDKPSLLMYMDGTFLRQFSWPTGPPNVLNFGEAADLLIGAGYKSYHLPNQMSNCWGPCNRRDGPCPTFCGDGYCCRVGRARDGCDGIMGPRRGWGCVPPPKLSDLNDPPATGFWHGVISNVALYTAAKLQPDRILAHYDAGIMGWHKSRQENMAVYLNGKSYVQIPASNTLDGIFSSFTIEVWVKLVSKRSNSILLSAGNHVLLSWETDNSIHCNMPGTDGSPTWRTGKDLVENIWTHVACTWDGATSTLVLDGNGADAATTTNSGSMSLPAGEDWHLGHGYEAQDVERFWRGEVEELRVWKTARSLAQIQSEKDNLITSPSDNMLLYYHLDEGPNAHIIRDASDNANNGFPFERPLWSSSGVTLSTSDNAPGRQLLSEPSKLEPCDDSIKFQKYCGQWARYCEHEWEWLIMRCKRTCKSCPDQVAEKRAQELRTKRKKHQGVNLGERKGKQMSKVWTQRLDEAKQEAKIAQEKRAQEIQMTKEHAAERANKLATDEGCKAVSISIHKKEQEIADRLATAKSTAKSMKETTKERQGKTKEAEDQVSAATEQLDQAKSEAQTAADKERVADRLVNQALNEVARIANEKKAAKALQETFQAALDKKKAARKVSEAEIVTSRRNAAQAEAHKAQVLALEELATALKQKHELEIEQVKRDAISKVCNQQKQQLEAKQRAAQELKDKDNTKKEQWVRAQGALKEHLDNAEREKNKGLDKMQCLRGDVLEGVGHPWSIYARKGDKYADCICNLRACKLSEPGQPLVCVDATSGTTLYSRNQDGTCGCKGKMCSFQGVCHHTDYPSAEYRRDASGACVCRDNHCMLDGVCTDLSLPNGFLKQSDQDPAQCAALGDARITKGMRNKVYIYQLDSGRWALESVVQPEIAQATEWFGSSAVFSQQIGKGEVSKVAGLQILLGASFADPNGVLEAGAVYVFEATQCGDNKRAISEGCEDGNLKAGDGCSPTCTIEPGYGCMGGSASSPDHCGPVPGDGRVVGQEACDDGNLEDGDGCSSDLTVEPSWTCAGGSTVTQSVCEECGNGLVAGEEQCDTGKAGPGSAENTGCTNCKVDKGYMCFGGSSETRSTCMLQKDYIKQVIERKVEVQEALCRQKGQLFVLQDISTGRGKCIYQPEKGEELVSALSTAGPQLSGADLIANQLGWILAPPVFLESVTAKDGTAGAPVTAVCKSARRVVCTSSSETAGAEFERSCMAEMKMVCGEVLVPADFCESNDDIKGKLTSRFGTPMCAFYECKVPESWVTPEGKPILPTAWCVGANEGSAVPVRKQTDFEPAVPESTILLQEDPEVSEPWLRIAQGMQQKQEQERTKRTSKDQLASDLKLDLELPGQMAWQNTQRKHLSEREAKLAHLSEQAKDSRASQIVREAYEVSQKELQKSKQTAVEDAARLAMRLPQAQAEHELVVLNAAKQKQREAAANISRSSQELKAVIEKEMAFKQEAAKEVSQKQLKQVAKVAHKIRAQETSDKPRESDAAKARAAVLAFDNAVDVEKSELLAHGPWTKRVADEVYTIEKEQALDEKSAARAAEQLSAAAAHSSGLESRVEDEQEIVDSLVNRTNAQKTESAVLQAKIEKLGQAKLDCSVGEWSEWSKCDQQCDQGQQTRKRDVVAMPENGGAACPALTDHEVCFVRHCERCGDGKLVGKEECDDGNHVSGDGCNEHCQIEAGWACNGGSTSSTSQCEQCGNGKVAGSEECDDSNSLSGDGCSSSCQVEAGYLCKGAPSSCETMEQYQGAISEQIVAMKHQCHADHNKEFMITDSDTGAGMCTARPSTDFDNGQSASIEQVAVSDGSGLSGGTTAVSRVISTLTKPTMLDSVIDSQGQRGARPYAVCNSASNKVCTLNKNKNGQTERVCKITAEVSCIEVAVDSRFCDVQSNDVQGQILQREHLGRTDSDGNVCVFKSCNVPSTWSTADGMPINPSFWCYDVAVQIATDTMDDIQAIRTLPLPKNTTVA